MRESEAFPIIVSFDSDEFSYPPSIRGANDERQEIDRLGD
jgi:hypothetical protein